jgi:hypothetical protein
MRSTAQYLISWWWFSFLACGLAVRVTYYKQIEQLAVHLRGLVAGDYALDVST